MTRFVRIPVVVPVWILSLGAALASTGCGGKESAGSDGGRGGGSTTPNSSGSPAGASSPGGLTSGPRFPGFGASYTPLAPGCGPTSAGQCTGTCEAGSSSASQPGIIRPPATLCFAGELDPTPDDPSAVIEQVIEEIDGRGVVHLRITFDPSFVDNTYGAGACCGWSDPNTSSDPAAPAGKGDDPAMAGKAGPMDPMAGKAGKGGHTFDDLVGSDHVEVLLTDGSGDTVMDFKLDYVSEDTGAPCGYRSLGVSGGEGKMVTGNAEAILGVSTSLDRNLNGCGYCLTVDSPSTDENYSVNPDAPNWDYRVVYEVWIDLAAFGASGFGQAYIESVHASPSKIASNTDYVEPTPCPPEWDEPYCPPDVLLEGRNCFDDGGECPPNYALYVASEGRSSCTPIPFSNYPGMTPCPAGYALDAASEGRYCLPE